MRKILSKLSLGILFDTLFCNFIVFLISFAWARFMTKSVVISIVICVVFLFIFNVMLYIIKSKKQEKSKINKNKLKEKESKTYALLLMDKSEIRDIIEKRYLAQKTNNYGLENIVITDEYAIGFYFENKLMTLEDGLKLIQKTIKLDKNKIKILCYECSEKDKLKMQSIENISVEIITKDKLYDELFRKGDIDIDCKIKFSNKKKMSPKQLIKLALQKNKAKKYFASGLLIFFCSLIVRYNIYYILASSILFLLALISYNEKKFQK